MSDICLVKDNHYCNTFQKGVEFMDKVLSKKVIIKIDKENFNVYRFLKSLGKDRKRFIIKALANLFPNAVEGMTITEKGNYNLSQIRCVSEVLNEMPANQDDKIGYDYELAMSFNTGQYSSDREAYIFALLTCLYRQNNLSTVIIKAVNTCYKGFFDLENLVQFDEWSGDPDLIRNNPRKRNIPAPVQAVAHTPAPIVQSIVREPVEEDEDDGEDNPSAVELSEEERQKKIEEYLAREEKELAELRQEATNSNAGYSNPDRDDQFDEDDDY